MDHQKNYGGGGAKYKKKSKEKNPCKGRLREKKTFMHSELPTKNNVLAHGKIFLQGKC